MSVQETLSGLPKSSSPRRTGTSGESASSAPAPNRVVTTTATAASSLISVRLDTAAIASAAPARPAAAPSPSGIPASEASTRPGSIECEIDSAA